MAISSSVLQTSSELSIHLVIIIIMADDDDDDDDERFFDAQSVCSITTAGSIRSACSVEVSVNRSASTLLKTNHNESPQIPFYPRDAMDRSDTVVTSFPLQTVLNDSINTNGLTTTYVFGNTESDTKQDTSLYLDSLSLSSSSLDPSISMEPPPSVSSTALDRDTSYKIAYSMTEMMNHNGHSSLDVDSETLSVLEVEPDHFHSSTTMGTTDPINTLFPSMETLQEMNHNHHHNHRTSPEIQKGQEHLHSIRSLFRPRSSPSDSSPSDTPPSQPPSPVLDETLKFPYTIPSLLHRPEATVQTSSDSFFSPVNTIPRNTVPVKCVRKFPSSSEFHPILMIRSIIKAHNGPIWTCAFSLNGKYFATGGKDGVILLWQVGCTTTTTTITTIDLKRPPPMTEKTRTSSSMDSNHRSASAAPSPTTYNNTTPPMGINVPILSQEPLRIFKGHTQDVVDLSWSNSSYLLSASLDKTILLWHPSRDSCLKTFYLSEIITAVNFHPMDDRYFLSAGFDKKCCIWSIPMESIVEWAQAPTFVSAARFTPDAKYIVAGLVNGMVIIYSLTSTISTTLVEPSSLNSSYPTTARSRLRTASMAATTATTTTTTTTTGSSDTPSFRDLPNNASADLQFVLRFYTQISCKKNRSKEGKKVTGFAFLQNLSEDKVILDTATKHRVDRRGKEEHEEEEEEDPTQPNLSIQSSRKKHFTTSTIRDHLKSLTHVHGIHTATRMKQNKVKQKLLVTTNDSRLRLIGLDDFCTVRQYKGSMVNNSLQIHARFSESGEYIVCGSETGTCTIWNTATKGNPLKMVVSGLTNYDKVKSHECFEASKADPPIVTDTIFVPSKSMKEALRASRIFPSMDFVSNVAYDFSSAAIITCDYEGSIRVFLRKSCLDAVYHAANDPIV